MHVLLLEPDRLLAQTYERALQTAGHTVTSCARAQTAVYYADDIEPDVVVMELQLAGHSGIEFLYEFRSYTDWQHVPIIILSHVPRNEFANNWENFREQLNIFEYHYKPISTLKMLITSVNDAVQIASA
jgi:two-component SAPR family response regulator